MNYQHMWCNLEWSGMAVGVSALIAAILTNEEDEPVRRRYIEALTRLPWNTSTTNIDWGQVVKRELGEKP